MRWLTGVMIDQGLPLRHGMLFRTMFYSQPPQPNFIRAAFGYHVNSFRLTTACDDLPGSRNARAQRCSKNSISYKLLIWCIRHG